MLSNAEKIGLLENFISRNNFSVSGWNSRGLHPSDPFISESLHMGFKQTATQLIDALNENASKHKMKSMLVSAMRECKKLSLDTEEKEYAADLFFELSGIVDINIKTRLNVFIYGYFLIGLIYIARLFRGKKKMKSIRQNCEHCNSVLVFRLEEKSIQQSAAWVICQCTSCNSYFLSNHQQSAKYLEYENCMPVEYLPINEFSY